MSSISKIKKLSRASRSIISQYGYSYFFEIAKQELRKQGLSIFYSSEPIFSKKTKDEQTKYKIWLTNHELTDQRKKNLSNIIKDFTNSPKFLFFIYPSSTTNNVEQTINSFLNQLCENWQLVIFSNSHEKIDTKYKGDKRIIFSSMPSDFKTLQKFVDSRKAEYAGFLNAGDQVTQDCLFYIGKDLNNNPNLDIIYTDEDKLNNEGERTSPFFKPDWCPVLFLGMNYINKLFVIRTKIFDKLKISQLEDDLLLFYDLLLQATKLTDKIHHVPLPLCSVKITESYDSAKTKNIIQQAMKRQNLDASVDDGLKHNTFRIKFDLKSQPFVSIIIPTKDKKNLLKRCIDSIEKNTNYKNWEIIVVDNNSQSNDMKSYLKSLPYDVLNYEYNFNFSKINNMAYRKARGDYILFLNDDTQVLDSDWLTELLSIGTQNDVGIVGTKLVFSDDTIQHGGIVFLKNGSGFHPFQRIPQQSKGYYNFHNVMREYYAVTGACLLIKKKIFEEVGLFDDAFDLYYGDADLCLKVWKAGYKVIYTPFTKLLHEGSATINKKTDLFIATENFNDFILKWPSIAGKDPYYNENFDYDYQIDNDVLPHE